MNAVYYTLVPVVRVERGERRWPRGRWSTTRVQVRSSRDTDVNARDLDASRLAQRGERLTPELLTGGPRVSSILRLKCVYLDCELLNHVCVLSEYAKANVCQAKSESEVLIDGEIVVLEDSIEVPPSAMAPRK